jgi:hypothetical protein
MRPMPLSTSQALSNRSSAPPLSAEQMRTQISDGHRLIRLARQKRLALYGEAEFLARCAYIDADYFMNRFIPVLLAKISDGVTVRVNAAIVRARRHAALYDVKKVGVAEYVAEAFYDSHLYNAREAHLPRPTLRDQIKAIIHKGEALELLFPIFSRKPFSPIKNRGPLPDLAEIVSLARCIEAVQAANTLCPTGCRLTLLADGLKYNRACRTPDAIIAAYQRSLSYWVSVLAGHHVVDLTDYEGWIGRHLRGDIAGTRPAVYANYCSTLYDMYTPLFDVEDAAGSLARIAEANDIGRQIAYTFWSIATSVNYRALDSNKATATATPPRYFADDFQRLYVYFISSLPKNLRDLTFPAEYLPSIGYFTSADFRELLAILRMEAWQAAIRYVSISLTDRDLNVLREIRPNAIKLTIHGKQGELHFLSASRRDASMTAQHCTGGIAVAPDGARVTLRYRLEREAENETPVLVMVPNGVADTHRYSALCQLQEAQQPIAYVNDRNIVTDRALHHALYRRD